ncbi:MAG: hypothetical protein BM564_00655 [Bacteroidetes bacterium MedPE-SWsnd-G2]|nr:MAG: hypothetical protein BM564_00655 [Bacteroidetes bacterium MedPE-SWsnd-G2]
MSLIKTSFYSGIGTGISLLAKLITNKVIAVYLGTNGMFLLGQLKDFLNIGTLFSTAGSNHGVVKYVAEYQDKPQKLIPFLSTALKVHLYSSVVVFLITFLFKTQISQLLFQDSQYANAIAAVGLSFISIALFSYVMSVLNGFRNIKLYVTINIISAILSAIITIYLVINYNIDGAFYAIAISQVLSFIISFTALYFDHRLNLKFLKFDFSQFHLKNLSKFSLMAVVGPVCIILSTLFVRGHLERQLGETYAGSWEGMWRISGMYILFLTTTFQFYIIPTFSNLDGSDLKKEIFKVWKLSFPAIIIITFTVYALKDILITFMFTEEFLLINTIILFHLLGDAVKINSWVLGNILISKANTKIFIAFQIGWAIIFCFLTYLFTKHYGFVGVSIAYFATYVLHFLCMNIYFRKLLWTKS